MPRILVVNGVCHYDHIRNFTNYVAFAMESLGCECQFIDSARPETSGAWGGLVEAFRPDMFFSFNGTGYQVRRNGKFLGGPEAPFFTFMVDDPGFHAHWLPFLRDPHVYCSLPNKNAILQAISLGIRADHCTKIHVAAQPFPLVRDSERTTDILFVGSSTDPELIRRIWRQSYSEGVVHLLEAVSEAWYADLESPLHGIAESALDQIGLEASPEQRQEILMTLVGEVNRYVRFRGRLDILRALRDLPVTIFGEGWRELLPDSNFTFRPKLAYHQAEAEICRAKIVLNPQPIAIHGVGERGLGAMLNGALLATTKSYFFEEQFRVGDQYLQFDCSPESLRAAREGIEYYLAHPSERDSVAMSARETALSRHTWAHRAKDVLQAMGMTSKLALAG